MLSKVLSRRDAGTVQPIVFPVVTPGEAGFRSRTGRSLEEMQDQGGDETVDLREKLRQLEGRAAAERRDSLEAGRRQGDQEARAELVPVMERLNASIAEITAMRPDLRRRAERDVVQLALLIAKRVLHRQLSVDEGALTAIARVAFERLTRSESYTVTVHPRFAASIASALPGNQISRVHIEPDPNCEPGTLIIHSAEGVIDASVDAQLAEISRGLADRLAGA
ncbi:MAG: FliH/SctL family protein [Bryobacteraceae bacterium]|jgi:flagellar assembly protein FliH